MEQSTTALLLLDRAGSVLHTNTVANALMRRSPILQLNRGRVWLRRRGERAAFERVLAGFTHSDVLMLRGRQGEPVMGLRFTSLTLPGTRLIVLRVVDLAGPIAAPPAALARMFTLTPAEARVASLLLDGLEPRAIGEHETMALETVRGHLKRGMAKAGARTQAQYVRLLGAAYRGLMALE